MIYGYARVSTKGQAIDGNSLEAQSKLLKENGAEYIFEDSFAEFERDMIIGRTQESKAIAKTKDGFKEGRPKKYTEKRVNHALSLLTINGEDKSYSEVVEITGISKSTLIRCNNSRFL